MKTDSREIHSTNMLEIRTNESNLLKSLEKKQVYRKYIYSKWIEFQFPCTNARKAKVRMIEILYFFSSIHLCATVSSLSGEPISSPFTYIGKHYDQRNRKIQSK